MSVLASTYDRDERASVHLRLVAADMSVLASTYDRHERACVHLRQ